jgi:hypothetical protein
MKIAHRIRLLKEWVRRLVRGPEVDDTPSLPSDSLDDCWQGSRRSSPDEEHSADTLQRGIERRWVGEIARDDFDICREIRAFWPPRERAYLRARAKKFVNHEPSDATRGTRDENSALTHV